jgi:TM2 domain-containing membrane protein YozV
MSTRTFQSSYALRRIIYGAIAGAIAGIVMVVIMTGLMTILKLPPNLFPMLLGTMIGQSAQTATITGIGLHFIASVAIGAIFGAVTSRIRKLMTHNFVKGITFGLITGIIAFVVLFVPVSITLLPQNMMNLMKMMNPGLSSQTIMLQLQGMQPMILIGSLLSHMAYGIILVLVTVTMERIFTKRDQRDIL